MPLARADTSASKRFEDGDAWLVLRTELTKRDKDQIADLAQHYKLDARLLAGDANADQGVEIAARAADTNRTLFALLAVSWSLSEGKPTAEDYDTLSEASGEWVDGCIGEILAERARRAEGNGRSRSRPASSPGSSRSGAKSRSRS